DFQGNSVIDFSNSIFENDVNFRGSKFKTLNFNKTIFKGKTEFNYSTFSNDCDFSNTYFHSSSDFDLAKFNGNVNFSSSHFFSSANFKSNSNSDKSSKFQGEVNFSNVKFHGIINFSNRTFNNKTNFSGCIFENAPEFHNCTFHQNTKFPEYRNFKDTKSEDASRAYRTLSLAMAHFKARREEAMFYALEQKSLRKNLVFFDKVFSYCYDISSNYGQSLGNVFFSMFILFILFLTIYGMWFSPNININSSVDYEIIRESFVYTIQQIVKPFNVWIANNHSSNSNVHYVLFLKIVSTIQSLLFLIFITLLVFTIRWKFKRE
ncbi:MAG: pentapeptide repeat-containing protein, partial [Bdellovibrionota bacterium]